MIQNRSMALFSFALITLINAAAALAEAPPPPPQEEVEVEVVIGSDTYNPYDPPDATLQIVVRNGTSGPVTLPGEYDSYHVTLFGQAEGHRWPLHLFRTELGERSTFELQSGAEAVMLTIRLDEILPTGLPDEWNPPEHLFWDWPAHPPGPKSPIHVWKKAEYVPEVSFWATVVIDEEPIESAKVTLTISTEVEDGEKKEIEMKKFR